MTTRVTVGSSAAASLAGLQSASARLAALQAKMSSGRQITTPSDDPAGTVRALQLRGDLKRTTQYATNATDAIGWLSTADTTYGQIQNLLQNARTLVVQGLNTGASTGTSASAIADQIDAIRSSAITLANTTYQGRPIFGGTTAGGVAYQPDGSYVGDDGVVQRAVGDQNTIRINQTGTEAFGPDPSDPAGPDVFALLSNISATLRGGAGSLSDQLGGLDGALNRLSGARAAEGAAYQRVQAAQTSQSADTVALQSQLSTIQDIDLPALTVQVSTANLTYQAALQTTASIRQTSLLDFLR